MAGKNHGESISERNQLRKMWLSYWLKSSEIVRAEMQLLDIWELTDYGINRERKREIYIKVCLCGCVRVCVCVCVCV